MIVTPDDNVFGCEFAATHIDAAARYVIGTAAALSNDFPYAEELLLDSEKRLKQYSGQAAGTPIAALLSKVQTRIVQLYQEWVRRLMLHYNQHPETRDLMQAEEIAGRIKRYEPNNYTARLSAAYCAFVLRRDLSQARAEISACREHRDGAWMYSDAFIRAYDGDLQGAYDSYKGAFAAPLANPAMPVECEEFIQVVLEKEPERYWLYYCLGLINYRAKHDLQAARNDFRAFLAKADAAIYETQIEAATKWIGHISALLDAVPSAKTETEGTSWARA